MSTKRETSLRKRRKILAYRSSGGNYIDLKTLRSWSQEKLLEELARKLQETT